MLSKTILTQIPIGHVVIPVSAFDGDEDGAEEEVEENEEDEEDE